MCHGISMMTKLCWPRARAHDLRKADRASNPALFRNWTIKGKDTRFDASVLWTASAKHSSRSSSKRKRKGAGQLRSRS